MLYKLLFSLLLNTNLKTECYQTDYVGINSLFNNYIREYNKSYSSDAEYWKRFFIFQKNVERINHVNANQEKFTYQLGFNNFTDMTSDEFSLKSKGYKGLNYRYRNYRLENKEDYKFYHRYTIPSYNKNNTNNSIDWRAMGYVTDIKDQGQCGSCWAFSAIGTMEGAWFKQSGNLVSLSEQDIVDCVTGCDGCGGGWPYMAIDWVLNHSSSNLTRHNNSYYSNDTNNSGVDTESSYPYEGQDDTCRFSSNNTGAVMKALVEIPSGSVSHLMDALFSVGPISVAIDAEYDLQMYKSGIYSSSSCSNTTLDHAVLLIGYGITPNNKTYYIVKNSWGTEWGQDGYVYFSADIPNMCGIATDACYAVA